LEHHLSLYQSYSTADAIVEYGTQLHPVVSFNGDDFPTTVIAPSKALVVERLGATQDIHLLPLTGWMHQWSDIWMHLVRQRLLNQPAWSEKCCQWKAIHPALPHHRSTEIGEGNRGLGPGCQEVHSSDQIEWTDFSTMSIWSEEIDDFKDKF
jgi:hypothetical protein